MKPNEKKRRVDPSLPFSVITLGGNEYRMCFDLGALAEAEESLVAKGHDVNLLAALPRLNLNSTRILFAASLYAFQPEISFQQALALVTPQSLFQVASAVVDAWKESMPEPDVSASQNPPEPVLS